MVFLVVVGCVCIVTLASSFRGVICCFFFFFKQKTAYEMRISDWSSDVCSSDLIARARDRAGRPLPAWFGCRKLRSGELFTMNPAAPDSFDGRYLDRKSVV